MPGEENVKVVCRVRPLNKKEKKKNEKATVQCINEQQVKIDGKVKKYNFDAVLGPDSTQKDVYEKGVKVIVEDVLKGYNGTIFAYGQTSSGKTYTMEGELGDDELKGIIPRIIEDIFNNTKDMKGTNLDIKISYFEIYNEKISDLMDKTRTNLPIHEDKNRKPYVKNLTEQKAKSAADINAAINKGKKNRHVTGTNMNEHSSRSHSVFHMVIVQDNKENHKKTTGSLYLVDLAGSEKVSKSGAEGQTLEEAKNINKSLSCLGNVISALTEKGRAHVPYRDSKLTRILQQSLGGNARTTVIICVSPAKYNEQESISTLNFGVRAKTIKNVVSANVEVSAAEWRNRFNKVNAHVTKVKDLALKLCKEAKKRRAGKDVPKKEQIDIDELIKLLEKGVDFDKKVAVEAATEKEEEGDPNEAIDEKRLKDRLSRTSIATKKSKSKDKDGKGKDKDKDKKKEKLSSVEEGEESTDVDPDDSESPMDDVPEDVLAVLRAEVDMKTKQLKEEKAKLAKMCDEKDDDISQLEQAKHALEEKMKGSERLIQEAHGDSKRAQHTIKAAQNEILNYKERNRRLEAEAADARKEVEAAEAAAKKKGEEVKQAAKEVQEAKNETAEAMQKVEEKDKEMESLKKQVADQLGRLADDVKDIGILVSGDHHSKEFDFQPSDKAEENLSALRVMLTKAKHLAEHKSDALKDNQSDKNEYAKQNTEQMVMINQAKEKIETLELELEKAQNHAQEVEERMNDRNAKIAQLAKEGGLDEEGLTDQELDADLQLLHDEHRKQLRDLRGQLEELQGKNDELNKEKEEWQMMAETAKADAEKTKAGGAYGSAGGEEMEGSPEGSQVDLSVKAGSEAAESEEDGLGPEGSLGEESEGQIQNLSQIKKDMNQAMARNRKTRMSVDQDENEYGAAEADSGGSGEGPPKKAPPDYAEGTLGNKQKVFLEATLDTVTKNNRALAAENRTLKVQRLPALQAMVKSLQAKNQELERLLKEERSKK